MVERMEYTLPLKDMAMSVGRMPARPQSGFIIADIRRRD